MYADCASLTLTTRISRVLLTLALLFSPSAAQVTAAEICRTRCIDAGQFAPVSACCAKVGSSGHDETRADSSSGRRSDEQGTDSRSKYCLGCGGRPLIVCTDRFDLSLAATPIFSLTSAPVTAASFDVPFSIFHPPRI
jgi:hypothetical protein